MGSEENQNMVIGLISSFNIKDIELISRRRSSSLQVFKVHLKEQEELIKKYLIRNYGK